jgi:very-short-patch-repair endonuclease
MTWGRRPRRKQHPPPLGGGGDAQSAAGEDRDEEITLQTHRSRALRRTQTASEAKLWHYLRRKQIRDVRFRRQFALGPYIVDFVCLRARLVVEVDGESHLDVAEIVYDTRRTAFLEREGYRVIRCWNLDVLTNIDGVIQRIDYEVQARLPAPLPPPLGGGGDAHSAAGEDRNEEISISRRSRQSRQPK